VELFSLIEALMEFLFPMPVEKTLQVSEHYFLRLESVVSSPISIDQKTALRLKKKGRHCCPPFENPQISENLMQKFKN